MINVRAGLARRYFKHFVQDLCSAETCPSSRPAKVEDYLRFRLIFSVDTKEFSKGVHEQSVFSHT
jgi:hypothetical protein